jgi:AcrR family transcriptional regulator
LIRRLWGDRGYAAVSTPEIAQAAGVTRGAMYHQYPDKAKLLLAVLEAVETDVIERLAAPAVTLNAGTIHMRKRDRPAATPSSTSRRRS